MSAEKIKFIFNIESLIKKFEPLNAVLMDFEGLLSNIPYHEWAKGAEVPDNVIEFSKELNKEVKRCRLPRYEAKESFRTTMGVYKRGPWIRATTNKRLDIREIRRPECIRFHKLHGPLPDLMKDSTGPKNRSNSRQAKPGSHLKRIHPRNLRREECRKFHAKYGPIQPSLIDNSGPTRRNGSGDSLTDFFFARN